MIRLMIFAFLGILGRISERAIDVMLAYLLDVRATGQGIASKVLTVVFGEGALVREEPRFHNLNHQLHLIVRRTCGLSPTVPYSIGQVLPRIREDHLFRIDQQDNVVVRMLRQGSAKVGVRFGSITRRYYLKRASRYTFLKEDPEGFATICLGNAFEAPFNVNPNAHQRFPPSSPVRQSCPNL